MSDVVRARERRAALLAATARARWDEASVHVELRWPPGVRGFLFALLVLGTPLVVLLLAIRVALWCAPRLGEAPPPGDRDGGAS